MSPRKSAAEATATRVRIIERALALAATDGLDGLTIGRLAIDLGMSKAGVVGHFGSKEALQIAVLEAAIEQFRRRVPARAVGADPGLRRLTTAFGEWIDYMAEDEGHSGCLLTSVAAEFDGRPGPIRDAVLAALMSWSTYVSAEVRTAVAAGELPPETDAEQVVFELNGIALAAAQAIQLHHDPAAPARARRAITRLLDVAPPPMGSLGSP
ncbi:TetR/AcrR family transcriptional regulator [Kitasatospora aureofaciens]|uniref:TetR/AcrR family transcriptional regulator n=1 Tax=Kitasatospora aureofaciens TaxID=1894 RepID=UPI001C48AA96|nr:TetR/AcrR family transcriptional regulator [Kitasatospora aureofaciens]MBV6699887.1 TetR/AcrR family transcriptional regulator [Kitasatospora aureofaciens]